MNEQSLKPVIEKLENLFSIFDKKFYNDELQTPVITVSPDTTSGAYGWCTAWKAWKKAGEKDSGYYEINICAEHLTRSFKELCSTMLHEMVHLWNLQNGVQDTSRGGTYHNKRFKAEAEKRGLKIDQHPKYGWTVTKLNVEAEQFIEQMDDTSFSLYRDSAAKLKAKKTSKSSSRKYVCPCCGCIVRATKQVHIMCGDCEMEFEEEE